MSHMKKLIIIVLMLCGMAGAKAQQLEQWTQFYANEYMVNPALAGIDKYFHAKALYRDQWVGIQDSPRTYYLSLHGPIIREKMGVGGRSGSLLWRSLSTRTTPFKFKSTPISRFPRHRTQERTSEWEP